MSQSNSDPNRKPPAGNGDGEEIEHYDDKVIGRAFRWSLFAGLILLSAAGVVFVILKPKPAPPSARVTEIAAPAVRANSAALPPDAKFSDITAEAGIRFVHNNGAAGDKLLPETMGGGTAFFDFDGDGDQDLLFVNSAHWPDKALDGRQPSLPALYANDGHGRFTDVTPGSGLDISFYGMGAAIGDFDNDGRPDVFMTAVGPNKLFRNLGGGKFADITEQAGVAGSDKEWSTSAAWLDYDNDGDLDLFVCNYVRWSKEIDLEVGYKLVGIGRAYGQPTNFEGSFPYFYRNDGGGKFAEITAEAGMQVRNATLGVPAAKSLGVAPVDIDSDGRIDIIVANDTVPNFLFHAKEGGGFEEIGKLSGVAFDSYGNTRGAMGIDTARFRNDRSLGIAIGNFANEMTALYVSQGNSANFADEAITEGIGPASRIPLKFGLFFFDYDLDGRLDILTANGHLEEEISQIQKSQQYRQPAQLFWNSGAPNGTTFVLVPPEKAGSAIYTPIVGRGSAFADIDNDGDLDVVMTQAGGAPLLLRNDQALGRHWARFKLAGKKSNRDGIGAWIRVQAGNQSFFQQIMAAKSYLSQSPAEATFGLGPVDRIDFIEITWPGGAKQTVPGSRIRIDAANVIEEEI